MACEYGGELGILELFWKLLNPRRNFARRYFIFASGFTHTGGVHFL